MSCYNETPRVCYNLKSSFRKESKTRQYPFVVASEVEGDNATREFLIFHDIKHFINKKSEYPHCHEIIRCPEDREDLAKGRLIFDFDLEKPLDNAPLGHYVPLNFKQQIEDLILSTFETFYLNVDRKRLQFVWQRTQNSEKFSMHLIVKNAYFSEYWVKQTRLFYELMKRLAFEKDILYLMECIDFQIARKNATFRMIGCSKIGKGPLILDQSHSTNQNFNIYDCLVGIYHHKHLEQEQMIDMSNINYLVINDRLEEISMERKSKDNDRFKSIIEKNLSTGSENIDAITIDDISVNKAVTLFDQWDQSCFKIRDNVDNIINLDRLNPGECPISGLYHTRENAYLKMQSNGHLYFQCRRGCNRNGCYSLDLGIYRTKSKKRPKDILPINTDSLKMAVNTTTKIEEYVKPISDEKKPRNFNFDASKSAKRKYLSKSPIKISRELLYI